MSSPHQKRCWSIYVILKTVLIKLATLTLAVTLFFLIPLTFMVISAPFCTFRYILKKSAKWLRPDLGEMVTIRGAVCAVDTLYTRPKSNVVVGLIFQGFLDIDLLKDTVTRNLLQGQLFNEELRYPELRQYLTSWLGYFFWKEDSGFQLERHVTMQSVSGLPMYSDADVQDIYQRLLQKPWVEGIPLWEISLLHNCYPKGRDTNSPHTVMFFRFHHTLCDGYSMLGLIAEGLGNMKSGHMNVRPSYRERTYFESLIFWATFPFRVCYEVAELVLEIMSPLPFTPLKVKEPDWKCRLSVTRQMPIKLIKDIKNHFRVSFASVVNAVCGGALRDIMVSKGMRCSEDFLVAVALPLQGHSDKLRNYMTGGTMKLGTGEPDPLKRLYFSSKAYDRLKSSVVPVVTGYLPILVGSFPGIVLRAVGAASQETLISCSITSFPGGSAHLICGGCKCVDAMFAAGLGPLGVFFSALSFVDGFRISVAANATVFTKEELDEVGNLLEKHVAILHELIIKDV